MQTLILTPMVDDRDGKGRVSSRIGIAADAIAFDGDDDVYAITRRWAREGPTPIASS